MSGADYPAHRGGHVRAELEAEWGNMLAHQLPMLPPFISFWEELPNLFEWLEGSPRRSNLQRCRLPRMKARPRRGRPAHGLDLGAGSAA